MRMFRPGFQTVPSPQSYNCFQIVPAPQSHNGSSRLSGAELTLEEISFGFAITSFVVTSLMPVITIFFHNQEVAEVPLFIIFNMFNYLLSTWYGLLTIKKGNKHMIILNGIEALIQLAIIASRILHRRALLKRTLILIVIIAVIFTCFFTIFQLALGERSKQIFFACASVIFYCIMQILPLFSLRDEITVQPMAWFAFSNAVLGVLGFLMLALNGVINKDIPTIVVSGVGIIATSIRALLLLRIQCFEGHGTTQDLEGGNTIVSPSPIVGLEDGRIEAGPNPTIEPEGGRTVTWPGPITELEGGSTEAGPNPTVEPEGTRTEAGPNPELEAALNIPEGGEGTTGEVEGGRTIVGPVETVEAAECDGPVPSAEHEGPVPTAEDERQDDQGRTGAGRGQEPCTLGAETECAGVAEKEPSGTESSGLAQTESG